eukprot:7508151-Pyramimonas_sp.AAC.1
MHSQHAVEGTTGGGGSVAHSNYDCTNALDNATRPLLAASAWRYACAAGRVHAMETIRLPTFNMQCADG